MTIRNRMTIKRSMIIRNNYQVVFLASLMLSILNITACSQQTDTNDSVNENEVAENQATQSEQAVDFPIEIDWKEVNHEINPVDRENYNYSFALDSEPVKNYAKMYALDNKTAQYNLTIGMISNEPLSKILDQVSNEYIGHQLTEGKNMTLVITTTDNVIPSQYNYVIEGEFAHGLVLPIKIQSASQ